MVDVVKFRNESASAYLVRKGKDLYALNSVVSQHRGQGHASKLMQSIIEYADDENISLDLEVKGYGQSNPTTLKDSQLVIFYASFGFELDKARSIKGQIHMVRHPSQEKHVL